MAELDTQVWNVDAEDDPAIGGPAAQARFLLRYAEPEDHTPRRPVDEVVKEHS